MTETTLENYQERAARTISLLGSNAVDGAHMALGITTEVEEMKDAMINKDFVNIREEHGDCNWYIANECNTYKLNFKELYDEAKSSASPFSFKLHNIVDLHKRELAYGKEMDITKLKIELISLIQYLVWVCNIFEFSYEESLVININKLYARYPEKFTQEAALNRDLDQEHEILK